MTQTVLVTGDFGQVGKRCAEILLRRGHTVIAMDLATEGAAATAAALTEASHPGTLITAHTALTDADAVAAVVERHRPGAVVHLAAVVAPPSNRNPGPPRKVKRLPTRHPATAPRTVTD